MKQVCKLSFPPIFCAFLATIFIVGSFGKLCAQNESKEAEGLWLKAYYLYKSAEEFEKQGEFLDARNKAGEAKRLYEAIAHNFPDYNSDLIRFKLRAATDSYARIRESYRQKLLSSTKQQQQPAQNQQQRPQTGTFPISPRGEFTPVPSNPADYRKPGFIPQPQSVAVQPPLVQPQYGTVPGTNNSFILPSTPSSRPQPQGLASSFLGETQRWQDQKDAEIQRLRRQNQQAEAEIARKKAEIASKDRLISERDRELNRMRTDPATAGESGRLLGKAMQLITELVAQNDQLKAQNKMLRSKIATQDEQIEKLTRERDDLSRIVEGKSLGSEQLRNLITENKRLSERLNYLQQIAERTAKDNQHKDRTITNLKYEIQKIQSEKDKLVNENVRHQVTIESLHRKLEQLSENLSGENQVASIAPEQQAENDLLRSVILKQLRNQAKQKHAKELILQQLATVGTRSTVLLETVEDMARGAQLTAEEKALFKSPQVAELIEEVNNTEQFELLSAPANPAKPKRNGRKTRVELSQIEKAARLDFKEGRLDEAEVGFLNFLHHRPQNVACLCNLGVLKLKLNNLSEAQNYLQRAVAIDPDSGLANYLLGRSYFLQNNHDEAYSFMERSIQLDPKNDKAQNCIGVIASQKGRISRAKRAFAAAIGINPNNGDAHFNLAILHTSQAEHDPKKVDYHYFKALDIYKAEQIAKGIQDPVVRVPAIESFLKDNPVKGV